MGIRRTATKISVVFDACAGPSIDAWALYVDKQGWFGSRDPDLAQVIVNELAQMPQFSEVRITHVRRLKDFAGVALADSTE